MCRVLQNGRSAGNGFTLVELMVVLVILCALGALALPAYQSQILSARRGLGALELLKVRARQEHYFLNYLRYADSLTELGFPGNPYVLTQTGNVATITAKNGIYQIGLASTSSSYTVTATPTHSQRGDLGCQILSIDASGLRSASGTDAIEDCW